MIGEIGDERIKELMVQRSSGMERLERDGGGGLGMHRSIHASGVITHPGINNCTLSTVIYRLRMQVSFPDLIKAKQPVSSNWNLFSNRLKLQI